VLTAKRIKPLFTTSTIEKPHERYFRSTREIETLEDPEIKNVNQNKAMRLHMVDRGFFFSSSRFYKDGKTQEKNEAEIKQPL
jgi:hypothetical protein